MPVSPFLEAGLRAAVARLGMNQKGGLTGTVSLSGVEATVAQRLGRRTTLSAYAGRLWKGPWAAGARVGVVW